LLNRSDPLQGSALNPQKVNIMGNNWGKTIRKVAVQLTMFAVLECVLDAAGVDTLADYSEFISQEREALIANHTAAEIVLA
jgi:hypothetical protein